MVRGIIFEEEGDLDGGTTVGGEGDLDGGNTRGGEGAFGGAVVMHLSPQFQLFEELLEG